MRTRIKICGFTNEEDARAAMDYGADALGFIFVPNSPRFVGKRSDLLQAIPGMPPFVTRVAVCRRAVSPFDSYERFNAVQYYEDGWLARKPWQWQLIRACRLRDEASVTEIAGYRQDYHALLLDAYNEATLGGSGETFNWELAVEAKRRFGKPIILAGGLTPENVQDAIATVRPYAVDVSSGVEAEPGRKDHAKLKAFIRAVQEFDVRHGHGD